MTSQEQSAGLLTCMQVSAGDVETGSTGAIARGAAKEIASFSAPRERPSRARNETRPAAPLNTRRNKKEKEQDRKED